MVVVVDGADAAATGVGEVAAEVEVVLAGGVEQDVDAGQARRDRRGSGPALCTQSESNRMRAALAGTPCN